jgi:hypothetical protein
VGLVSVTRLIIIPAFCPGPKDFRGFRYAEAFEVGRTSMRIKVKAWRRGRSSEEKEMIMEAILIFVALDANGRPSPLPELLLMAEGVEELGADRFCATIVPVG